MQTMKTGNAQPCIRPDEGHSGGLLLVIVLGLGLSVGAGFLSSGVMRHQGAQASAPTAVTPAGANLQVMAEVTSVSDDGLQARLLERHGDAYVANGGVLHVTLNAATRYVMGSRGDLKPGAVLQLKGIALDAGGHVLQAEQAVILTSYVQVQGVRP